MNSYEIEIFKFNNMLNEYQEKLNNAYDTPLGNPKYDYKEGINKFYSEFFKNEKLDDVCKMYVDGLQWLVDYYYNGITYQKWYYIYDKTPLLTDILEYLLKVGDNNIFKKSKKLLENCCLYKSITEELTPLEQLIYITPFDKDASQIKMLTGYDENILKQIRGMLSKIFLDEKFIDLYPDLEKIAKNIYDSDSNNDIDCRNAYFLNNCMLKVVKSSNMIDETKFRNFFRKHLSTEIQQKTFIENLRGGENELFEKMTLLKKKFLYSGDLKYKNEYKRLKHFLLDH